MKNAALLKSLRDDSNVAEETIDAVNSDKEIDAKLLSIRGTLNNPAYTDLETYFNRVKYEKRKYWYSLLDGPSSLKKLIESLGMGSRYKVSYGYWSGQSHGWDIINRNLFFENGTARIIARRNPTGSYLNTLETIMIVRRGLMDYVGKRLKPEIPEFIIWLKEFSTRFESIFQ
jgi:hypothetical protein